MIAEKEPHPFAGHRPFIQKKAMGTRVKMPNGDPLDVGRGSVAPDGKVTRIPVLDMEIFMFLDEPGVYYDRKMRKMPEEVAAKVGFDVKREAKLRAINERRKEVMSEIADVVEENTRTVVETRGDYQLVEINEGQFTVTGPGGDFMDPNDEVVARELFDALAGEPDSQLDMTDLLGKKGTKP